MIENRKLFDNDQPVLSVPRILQKSCTRQVAQTGLLSSMRHGRIESGKDTAIILLTRGGAPGGSVSVSHKHQRVPDNERGTEDRHLKRRS